MKFSQFYIETKVPKTSATYRGFASAIRANSNEKEKETEVDSGNGDGGDGGGE